MRGLAIFFVHILSGLIHGLYHFVKGDLPCRKEEAGEIDGTDRAHCRDGIPLDAGDLHKTVDRVAGKAQIVLHGDFGGVFNLVRIHSV